MPRARLLLCLLLAACGGREPAAGPDAVLALGGPMATDAGVAVTMAVHLGSRISKSEGLVTLRLLGVRFDPEVGGAAEVYLVNPGNPAPGVVYDPRDHVGSVAALAGQPGPIDVQLEVKDFEAGGQRYLARTHLREMAGVAVALVVTQGTVTFEDAVLTAE